MLLSRGGKRTAEEKRELSKSRNPHTTPWKTNMDPENHWLVEENTLPGGQDVRVYVSFRECMIWVYRSLPVTVDDDGSVAGLVD